MDTTPYRHCAVYGVEPVVKSIGLHILTIPCRSQGDFDIHGGGRGRVGCLSGEACSGLWNVEKPEPKGVETSMGASIPLALTFHTSIQSMRRVIGKNVKFLSQNDSTKHLFQGSHITAYKRHREYLVRASKPFAILTDSPGSFPSGRGRCNTC